MEEMKDSSLSATKEIIKYHCDYCKYDFEQGVRTSRGGKHSRVSTQVKCPRCGNGLLTWPYEKPKFKK